MNFSNHKLVQINFAGINENIVYDTTDEKKIYYESVQNKLSGKKINGLFY